MGTLFVISGPSGVGKGTLVNLLMQDDKSLVLSVSCTTRRPRVGEVNGKSYFFISQEEFLKRKEENGFLEWDEHFGNYYGTPKSFVLEQLKTRHIGNRREGRVAGSRGAERESGGACAHHDYAAEFAGTDQSFVGAEFGIDDGAFETFKTGRLRAFAKGRLRLRHRQRRLK